MKKATIATGLLKLRNAQPIDTVRAGLKHEGWLIWPNSLMEQEKRLSFFIGNH